MNSAKRPKANTKGTSQRPIRSQHNQRYFNNQEKVAQALCQHISCRRIDIRAREVCRDAKISPPTFYAHFSSCSDALHYYENYLKDQLLERIPENATRSFIFTVIPIFIIQNRSYFLATSRSYDHYLIMQLFDHLRDRLVSDNITDRIFKSYSGHLSNIITCWLEFDQLNHKTATICTKKLCQIRPSKIIGITQ